MFKTFLMLAGSAVLLLSCGSENKSQVQVQQIDSIVNVKVKQHDAENAARNDSTLKAIETEKAEAIASERMEEKKRNEKNLKANRTDSLAAPQHQIAPPPARPTAPPGVH